MKSVGKITSSALRSIRDAASDGYNVHCRDTAERATFVAGQQSLVMRLIEAGVFVIEDDETPFLPGTTVAEMIDTMVENHRSPGRDELQALVERVVANTCEHLQQDRLGTLTIERYIVQEKHR